MNPRKHCHQSRSASREVAKDEKVIQLTRQHWHPRWPGFKISPRPTLGLPGDAHGHTLGPESITPHFLLCRTNLGPQQRGWSWQTPPGKMGLISSQQGWWWIKFHSMWKVPSTVLGSANTDVPEVQQHTGTGRNCSFDLGRKKEDPTEKAVLGPGAGGGFLWAEEGEGMEQSRE